MSINESMFHSSCLVFTEISWSLATALPSSCRWGTAPSPWEPCSGRCCRIGGRTGSPSPPFPLAALAGGRGTQDTAELSCCCSSSLVRPASAPRPSNWKSKKNHHSKAGLAKKHHRWPKLVPSFTLTCRPPDSCRATLAYQYMLSIWCRLASFCCKSGSPTPCKWNCRQYIGCNTNHLLLSKVDSILCCLKFQPSNPQLHLLTSRHVVYLCLFLTKVFLRMLQKYLYKKTLLNLFLRSNMILRSPLPSPSPQSMSPQ